jgi:hypothetical protein
MPVKSLYRGALQQSCTTFLSPALSVCRWPRGGVARRNRERTRGTRLQCKPRRAMQRGRCRTVPNPQSFRSHPKKFLTRPFQFPRSDNHVTVCLCQRSAPRGPRRSSSHVDDQGAPHGDPRVPLQGGACQHRPFGRWIGPWRAPRPPLKSLVENIARCWGSPEALPGLGRCEGPNVVAQLLTRPPLLCFRRA